MHDFIFSILTFISIGQSNTVYSLNLPSSKLPSRISVGSEATVLCSLTPGPGVHKIRSNNGCPTNCLI